MRAPRWLFGARAWLSRQPRGWASQLAWAALPGLVAFLVYFLTLEREVGWADSAELALQAYRLGATHPPGAPVYVLLARPFTLAFSEAAFATNLLSAASASLAVTWMSLTLLELAGMASVALLAPLGFAFAPLVWPLAIMTEVYGLNLAFFGAAVYALLHWRRTRSSIWLMLCAVIFGVSIGVSTPNLALLTPAFLLAVALSGRGWFRRLLLFGGLAALSGGLALSASLFLARQAPPLGTAYPLEGLVDLPAYVLCFECPTVVWKGADFYLQRVVEFSRLFAANHAWVGVLLGLAGLIWAWREQRDLGAFFTALLVCDLGYMAYFPSWEYYRMAAPAYYTFAVCIACSALLVRQARRGFLQPLLVLLLAGMAIFHLLSQYPEKRERARSQPVTRFALASLQRFPPQALVVSEWGTYTVLLYFQEVHGARPDVLLIERAPRRRGYDFGWVESYKGLIRERAAQQPVVVDRREADLAGEFDFQPVYKRWLLLLPRVP
ncbi:MAG: DUF2723 domain-containing protein [Anaerolineales bacterium]|nr:DUF2723 domain-containing protein [Anaerolineales bacterium]